MVKDKKALEDFNRERIRKSPPDYEQNFEIYEALYNEAVALKILPPKNSLEGIEADIRIAKFVNNV